MPQGCDFTCRNTECAGFEKTIVMHGIWPTMCIDDAIAEYGDDIERINALELKKAEGRVASLFVYPKDKSRQPVGYRVQLYCPICLMMDNIDCGLDKNEAKNLSDNPSQCGKCSGNRLSLKTAVVSGIPCPICHVKLHLFHWFTK